MIQLPLGLRFIPAPLVVPIFAFLGALAALLLIERVATVNGRLTVYTVLLTGAIFNAFSAALIYFIQSLASLEELHAIVFHLMGRVREIELSWIGLLAIAIAVPHLCGSSPALEISTRSPPVRRARLNSASTPSG